MHHAGAIIYIRFWKHVSLPSLLIYTLSKGELGLYWINCKLIEICSTEEAADTKRMHTSDNVVAENRALDVNCWRSLVEGYVSIVKFAMNKNTRMCKNQYSIAFCMNPKNPLKLSHLYIYLIPSGKKVASNWFKNPHYRFSFLLNYAFLFTLWWNLKPLLIAGCI
jgi:hypothetical protein